MKRRNIIKIAASSTILPAASIPKFSYGAVPAAVLAQDYQALNTALRLPLTNAGIPSELSEILAGLGALLKAIHTDEQAAAKFAVSPQSALASYGLGTILSVNDPTLAVIRATLDPQLKAKAAGMNYREFVREMTGRGLILRSARSQLKSSISAIIEKDLNSYRKSLNKLIESAPQLRSIFDNQNKLAALVDTLQNRPTDAPAVTYSCDEGSCFGDTGGGGGSGGGGADSGGGSAGLVPVNIAIVILATVVAYISVAVAATVVLMAGFSISIAASVGVVPLLSDPTSQLQRDTSRAVAVAKLLGREDLAIATTRSAIDDQLYAITTAARELGILKIPRGRIREFDEKLKQLAYSMAGVA